MDWSEVFRVAIWDRRYLGGTFFWQPSSRAVHLIEKVDCNIEPGITNLTSHSSDWRTAHLALQTLAGSGTLRRAFSHERMHVHVLRLSLSIENCCASMAGWGEVDGT